jgi:hypothetical protein
VNPAVRRPGRPVGEAAAPRSYRLRFPVVSVAINTIGMMALPIRFVGGVVVISARAIMSVSTIEPVSVLA